MTKRQAKQIRVKASLTDKLRAKTQREINKHGIITQTQIEKWAKEHKEKEIEKNARKRNKR
jgi:hypothetical protein